MNKLLVLATVALIGSAHAAKWDRNNNPKLFDAVAATKINMTFHDLPLSARLLDDSMAWSETFWPSRFGGIAYRWNHPNPQPFKYTLHTKEELLKMSEKELSQLSPSELYDIAMGDYGYTLTKKTLKSYKPDDLWWEGICDGWALAASHYSEPDKTVVTNKDGIKVPFGASDVKGLLSMHEAYNANGMYARVGARCKVNGKVTGESFPDDKFPNPPAPKDANRPECADVNAGAFHVVIANMIGINSQGFIAEVDRYNDVWNQPVYSYDSKIVGELPLTEKDIKAGIDKKIQIKTDMTYAEELVFWKQKYADEGYLGFVSKEPVTGTLAQTYSVRNYEYVIELDNAGQVIGGEWISETRPDMIWAKAKVPKFINGKYPLAGLSIIYKPVVHSK
ncbi:hypothetical protein [Peredibacter starrii]|uniref:Uncharacterized protein n=1 Tax=Peredibacter starrii TaxID=28202 RepID=A0AAX4HUH5_9BACT|nr:hypothetical protein [Peredibacter starrii]WPU67030.1 hypothetical protein SOO65_09725 [Peredibacter starrii]